MASALEDTAVLTHPFVVGELALGKLQQRDEILRLLGNLPAANVASQDEVLALIERRNLAGAGIGWVDAHLLASALLSDTSLWTLDRKLTTVVMRLGLAPKI